MLNLLCNHFNQSRTGSANITPKKVYQRKHLERTCRLCAAEVETKRCSLIFSKSGFEKDLARICGRTCGIVVAENDGLPQAVCRKCETFIQKMWNFRKNCQKNQIKLRQSVSLKRMYKSPIKKEDTEEPITQSRKRLSFKPLLSLTTATNKENILKSVSEKGTQTDDIQPDIISITPRILQSVKIASDALCRREGGSMLLSIPNETYNSMANFSFIKLWEEMTERNPILLQILLAASGKEHPIQDTPHELQVKYSFIYSILMNIRWHELSLMQRVNTVNLIEGGCSKEVGGKFW